VLLWPASLRPARFGVNSEPLAYVALSAAVAYGNASREADMSTSPDAAEDLATVERIVKILEVMSGISCYEAPPEDVCDGVYRVLLKHLLVMAPAPTKAAGKAAPAPDGPRAS
jgi:hypothetical protein